MLWPRQGFAPHDALHEMRADDIHDPHAAELLSVLIERVDAGQPTDATAVMSDLVRRGAGPLVRDRLIRASTSGGSAEHVREHAAAVVANSLRRRITAGSARLAELAESGSERDLRQAVAELAARAASHAARLDRLRREDSR